MFFLDFQIIENAINLNKSVKSKGIDWDLVTEYDRKIEDDLQEKLSMMYPQHKYVYEKGK